MKTTFFPALLAATLLCQSFAAAQTTPTDKSQYTLFNPTPRDQMREMSPDRPDVTESPTTVDAGHFQFELSFFEYTRNNDDGVRTDTWDYVPSNIKVGLCNNADLQVLFTPYQNVRTKSGSSRDTADGFGDDTLVRLKMNLWGNDSTENTYGTAFAVMPFVKFPTGSEDLSNDHVEGGLILPLSIELPAEFALSLMAEIDLTYNEAEGDYGVDFVHTASISHDVPGIQNLAAYLEYVGIAPYDTGSTYQAIGSIGLVYKINEDWFLDLGARFGLSDSANDFTLFAGTSFRF